MLSIATPTYNRAYILHQAYESLCNQTVQNFEWIVVDDGSTDDTEKLVKSWQKAKLIDIVYIKKENGGKPRALNDAANVARYNWVHFLDSDDFLANDAVESFIKWTKSIEEDPTFAGVAGLSAYISTGEVIGEYPKNKKHSDFIDILPSGYYRNKNRLNGDKNKVIQTELVRKFAFPAIEGEKFAPESIFWNRLAQEGLKIRFFNKVTQFCEYLYDGYSKNYEQIIYNNFEGFTLAAKSTLKVTPALAIHRKLIDTAYYFLIAERKGLSLNQASRKLGVSYVAAIVALVIGTAVGAFSHIKDYGFASFFHKARSQLTRRA